MIMLLPEQAEALRQLQDVCRELGVDVVVVGAIGLRTWLRDEHHMTADLDVAIALELDDFEPLTARLAALDWHRDPRWEPRWHASLGARVDLLPVGARARREKQIVWPRAETRMRVVGFDYVFRDAVTCELAPGLSARVAPLAVLVLLKIVSYLDDPHARQKDLGDLLTILRAYEEDGARRFSDDVLDAGVQYDEAGAFLLGHDLKALCPKATDERDVVQQFVRHVGDPEFHVPVSLVRVVGPNDDDVERPFVREVAAFARGFGADRNSSQ
jgi:predicted nucleotidyltransferase